MSEFEKFKKIIVGKFNNLNQIKEEKKLGEQKLGDIIHPIAKHINAICNDKINNLPKDFKGIFVLEESYYTFLDTNKTNVLPHLFLFDEVEGGHVRLRSLDIPKDISKKDFTNSNTSLKLDYNSLIISEKFTPVIYKYSEDRGFYGKSLSSFGPETTFLLEETLTKDKLIVHEILKKGDDVLVGFKTPLIYCREDD